MRWLTIIWSGIASAYLTLGLIHLGIWLKDRSNLSHLLFAVVAIAVAGVSVGELLMWGARTPEEFGLYMRWTHVPLFVTIVGVVAFVHVYLGTGRAWLAWAVIAVRSVILVVNFSVWPNINYARIDTVTHYPLLGGESVAVAAGVISPWTRLAQLGLLVFLAFLIDATVQLWRRGTYAERQRALTIGGSMTLFVLLASCHTALVQQQVLRTPYMISIAFLAPLVVMTLQLMTDVVYVSNLSRLLEVSESHLREAGERVELAAAAAKLGFWEWNVRRNSVWVTDQFRRLLGLGGSEDVVVARLLERVHPDDRSALQRFTEHSLSGSGDYETHARIVLRDGRTRWLGARGRVELNSEGAPVLMRGVVLDLTDRKQAEIEAASQRNELAHLSRVTVLGELSGSLAHELNQPLTAILSNAQAALRFLAMDNPDMDEVRASLQDIVNEDKRAGEVISGLRMLFKKGEVHQQALDVNALVKDVFRFLNSDFVNHMVSARTELRDDLPRIFGDRVQLQQVLINLIVNGYDAMAHVEASGRKLLVRTENMNGDGVHISVCDRGCGIPPERMESVFEPFVTTKNQGMGLGLAVCRTIVSAHGGRLWVTNNPDHGATFHVALPPNNTGAS